MDNANDTKTKPAEVTTGHQSASTEHPLTTFQQHAWGPEAMKAGSAAAAAGADHLRQNFSPEAAHDALKGALAGAGAALKDGSATSPKTADEINNVISGAIQGADIYGAAKKVADGEGKNDAESKNPDGGSESSHKNDKPADANMNKTSDSPHVNTITDENGKEWLEVPADSVGTLPNGDLLVPDGQGGYQQVKPSDAQKYDINGKTYYRVPAPEEPDNGLSQLLRPNGSLGGHASGDKLEPGWPPIIQYPPDSPPRRPDNPELPGTPGKPRPGQEHDPVVKLLME